MSEPLVTYLHDHLAGSVHAIETLKMMRDRHKNVPLGEFARELLNEIEQDRETLKKSVVDLRLSRKRPPGWPREPAG
jgi:ketol-acid reductoisomerase